MTRFSVKVCLMILAFVLTSTMAQADTFEISFPGKGSLGLVGGKVYLIQPPNRAEGRDWSLSPSRKEPGYITAMGSQWAGWYLVADPEEGEIRVAPFKGRRFPPGSGWRLTRIEQTERFLIQVASGKYKGWYLDVEEKGTQRGKGVDSFTVYQVKLSKRPGKNSKMRIVSISR